MTQLAAQAVGENRPGVNVPVRATSSGMIGVALNAMEGAFSSIVLAAATSNPGTDATWKSETGCKQFDARIAGTPVAGTGVFVTEGVAIAWSTTYDAHAALGTILTAAVGQADATPSAPPVELANCALLLLLTDRIVIPWDGTTRIKTIAARAIGATPAARNVVIGLVT
jgi:hypothetical protein